MQMYSYIFWFVSLVFSAGVGITIALFNLQPDFSRIVLYTADESPSIVLDDEGNELFRFAIDRRAPVMLSTVPPILIKAFLAAEDRQFFNHHGISYKGIIRSLLVNCYHRRAVQGASTITQQLVKLLFLHNKKTFVRKIQEQFYALLVEQKYSKEQILQAYLNNVYFGCGIYGIQAACHRFWGISVADITCQQAALLAGIVRSPNYYCPLRSLTAAQERAKVVLHSMKVCGYITDQEYADSCAQPITMQEQLHDDGATAHIKEWLRQLLEKKLGKKELYTGGYTIQTTLNAAIQQKAYATFYAHCKQLRATLRDTIDGGLITIGCNSGAIKALVGGYDFTTSQFNRALYGWRQIGSTIKPFIYAAGLQQGMQLYETEIDEPFSLGSGSAVWSPHNYDKKFRGQMTRAYALARSNNIVTIKTLLKLGAQHIVDLLARVDITHNVHAYPSLALGCVDATLKQIVSMFNVFANDGVFVEPYVLSWIKDKHGCKIWHHTPHRRTVLPSRIVGSVASVLQHNLYHTHIGTPFICKTGTTNDSCTCFFVGSTPEYTTGVYIGCDDNTPLGADVYPRHTAVPIVVDLYKNIPLEKRSFRFDPSLRPIYIHERTGAQVAPNDPAAFMLLV